MQLLHRATRAVRGDRTLARDSRPAGRNARRVTDPRLFGPAAASTDQHHIEEVLSEARVALAAVLAALSLAAGVPLTPAVAYLVCSLAMLAAVRRRSHVSFAAQIAVHLVDLAVPLILAAAIPAERDLASALFLLPLAGAALRWGDAVSIATTAAIIAAVWPAPVWSEAAEAFGAAGATAVMGGTLLGLIGLVDHRRRREQVRIEIVREHLHESRGFKAMLLVMLSDLIDVFGARSARLITYDVRARRTFLWEFTPGYATLLRRELPEGNALAGVLRDDGSLARDGAHVHLNAGLVADQWIGRVQVTDPARRHRSLAGVRLLERTVQAVIPDLYAEYRLSHARAVGAARQRERLARELHDGLIQSLIGTEMYLEVLSRRMTAEVRPEVVSIELKRMRDVLRQEILGVRELMGRMKRLDVSAETLADCLAQIVDRFAYDTGIAADFGADPIDAPLGRHACAEIVRIVQEALSNVRKHSGAGQVHVELRTRPEGLLLLVADNGRGFPFTGRFSLDAPTGLTSETDDPSAARNAGRRPHIPIVIRESVHALGGRLVIDSRPGRGARLEIAIPVRAGADRRTSRIAS